VFNYFKPLKKKFDLGVGFSLNGETVDLSPPSIGQKRVGIGHSMGLV
jgi:hypothetical protein